MRSFIDIITEAPDSEVKVGGCSCCFNGMDNDLDEAHDSIMNYDIQKKYQEFNNKYFSGELPDIPISWTTRKGVGGLVTFKVRAKPGFASRRKYERKDYRNYELVPDTMKMMISRSFLRDEKSLDGILLHEMIHVYMASIAGLVGEQHGANFMKKLRELSATTGIDIPLTDDTTDAVMNPETKLKEIVVMLVEKKNGDVSFGVLNKKSIINEDALVALSLDWANRAKHFGFVVKLYVVKDPTWTGLLLSSNIKEQRSKGTTLYKMNPDLKESLLAALEKSELLITLPPQT